MEKAALKVAGCWCTGTIDWCGGKKSFARLEAELIIALAKKSLFS
jgi:hypothetical protein